MRTGDTPEARILCTRFLPSNERVVSVLLFAWGRLGGFCPLRRYFCEKRVRCDLMI
jgi:putative transposase